MLTPLQPRKRKTGNPIAVILASLIIPLLVQVNAFAQKNSIIKIQAKTIESSRGADNPNIKKGIPASDTPVAESKGSCIVSVENRTGYYVMIFKDGYYMGTVSPWGKSTLYAEVYSLLYFISAGYTREWKPENFKCADTTTVVLE